MAKLTVDQQNFVKELAYLAYGTGGKSERTQGGKGNMGLMYAKDGSVHVFKFNTHGSQADAAQRQVAAGQSADVLTASNALRNELEKLAITAGLPADAIEKLLGPNVEGKSLLTRKVVAKFVTGISENCKEVKDVWNGVTGVKSAGDMAFDKVANPRADYAKFNRSMDSINAAFDTSVRTLESAASSLHDSMDPRVGNLAWLNKVRDLGGSAKLDAATFKMVRIELKKLDDRGFGFLADRDRSIGLAIGSVIAELHPEFTVNEIGIVLLYVEESVTSRAFDVLVKENTTFKDLVSGIVEEKLAARKLQEALRAHHELQAALEELKDEFEKSDDLKNEPFIRDNLHILGTIAAHYDSAMKYLGAYATRKNTSDYLMNGVEKRLDLRTLKGARVDIHKHQGSVNLANGLEVAHGFASIYKLAKKKGKVHSLLLALNEDGCFSARMDAIQSFAAKLEGGEVMDVQHKPGESVEDGLINELGASVQEYMKAHDGETPTWTQIKDAFGDRMRGKEFAGIVWTPHKIYENITENVLKSVMVDVDKDFLQNKADVGKVHFAQL